MERVLISTAQQLKWWFSDCGPGIPGVSMVSLLCIKGEPQDQNDFPNNIETLSFWSHSLTSIKMSFSEAVCFIAAN